MGHKTLARRKRAELHSTWRDAKMNSQYSSMEQLTALYEEAVDAKTELVEARGQLEVTQVQLQQTVAHLHSAARKNKRRFLTGARSGVALGILITWAILR